MIGEYAARFDEMAEEVWLDYGVDCRPLWGLGVEALASGMRVKLHGGGTAEVQQVLMKRYPLAAVREDRRFWPVRIGAEALNDLSPVQSHRLIYQALDEMMGPDIHALSIEVVRA